MKWDVTHGAPDPEDAGRLLERITDAASEVGLPVHQLLSEGQELPAGPFADPDVRTAAREIVSGACRQAPYLAKLLIRDPRRIARVAASSYLRREKPAGAMVEELAARIAAGERRDERNLMRALRHYRADEMVRLGIRELGLGHTAEVGRELAHLADACFDAAIAYHDAALRARYGSPEYEDADGRMQPAALVVIGMGKLGGEELNFASDVDVIYFYSSDNGSAGDLSLHEYYSKLCRKVTAALHDVTEDDVVFRVDLRLRPEGQQGPIANSVPSAERYYETWGRPWERQAWLKARPCAGSRELGRAIMDMLRPFVYPRSTSPAIVQEVRSLNRRIKASIDTAGIDTGFDVKNGAGGIRELEFFTQALQLIHSGQKPALRARTTLIALDQLLFAGLISEAEYQVLSRAYRYLRRVEHMLQLDSGRQTQRLPAAGRSLQVFARRLGCANEADFSSELVSHTDQVARLFATLGADQPDAGTGASAPDEDQRRRDIATLLASDLTAERALPVLGRLGFRDPAHAWHELQVARDKPLSPLSPSARGAAERLAPDLLREICTSPDPDRALMYVSDLISRRGAWSSIWRLFDDNPAIMRLLLSLFGTSNFLAKRFLRQPELIDMLMDVGRSPPQRSMAALSRELDSALATVDPRDQGEMWNRLAEFKNTQTLRIGLADVGGQLDVYSVCRELSMVAEVCLQRGYEWVARAVAERHGVARERDTGEPAALAVLALGKLGAHELGYGSDLDVIFVYSAAGESDGRRPIANVTYMTRVAQRLMRGLHALHPSGRLYELDTRLRPSGSKGLLVSTLAAWNEYHRGDARLWERQALTKLRPVAGSPDLGAEVQRAAARYVYGATPGRNRSLGAREIASEVSDMRARIERELADPGEDFDVKAGRGGIIDIEFASQYLQLAFGPVHPDLRSRSTVESLHKAAELGLADPADCELLCAGYEFLRRLEHRMRIVHDRSVHKLPSAATELDKLARRVGYPDGEHLRAAYEHWTEAVRGAYERVLCAHPSTCTPTGPVP